MNISDIKDVLTFAAFRPESDDRKAAWSRRFANRRSLLLNIGRNQTSWKGVGRNGKLVEGGEQEGEFKEIAPRLAEEWRALTEDGWCAISMNSRYVISLETNVSRKPGAEELIRTNPRMVLGARYERGKRYTFTSNSESVSTILLAVDEEQIKQLETQLREIGLKPGRICCGTYAMLRRLLETAHPATGKESGKSGKNEDRQSNQNNLYIVCCAGSLCVLLETGELWPELRSRSELYKEGEGGLDPVIPFVEPFLTRIDASTGIYFASDQENSPVLPLLREKLLDIPIQDLTQRDHLWKLIADL